MAMSKSKATIPPTMPPINAGNISESISIDGGKTSNDDDDGDDSRDDDDDDSTNDEVVDAVESVVVETIDIDTDVGDELERVMAVGTFPRVVVLVAVASVTVVISVVCAVTILILVTAAVEG